MSLPLLPLEPIDDLMRLLKDGGFELTHQVTRGPEPPELMVDLAGPDAALLTARSGELLLAIEHIAAKLLQLEPEEHDRLSFDAGGFKVTRDRELRYAAEAAVAQVRASGAPFAFPPMTSRERRLLHLALKDSNLPTASSGVAPRRFVVLYPEAVAAVPAITEDRALQVRSSFRRR